MNGELKQAVRTIREKGCVLLLDFDGTLAPLAERPTLARMLPGTRRALARAARVYPVAIITGRAVEDVRRRVRLDLAYAGNHGFDMHVGGRTLKAALPKKAREALAAMRRECRALERRYPGALFEDKGNTLALHFRKVPGRFHDALKAEARAAARIADVRVVGGILLLNILPAGKIDKGVAARRMFDALAPSRSALPVFIGDDDTDETAFRALRRRGITVRVGRKRGSAAHFFLKNRTEVDSFLAMLV